MRKPAVLMFITTLICCSSAVWAEGEMKPGLWEMTVTSDAFKAMPKMSPEQMEQMRKMGVNMPKMQDGSMVTKVCMTKELLEHNQTQPPSQKEAGCQTKNVKKDSRGYSMDLVCDGENMKGTGKVKGVYSGREGFQSTYDFKGTSHGRPVNQHHESKGKWLEADCGTVKPITLPAQKQ